MNIDKFENVIFGARKVIIGLFVVITLFMLWAVSGLRADASLEKMVPLSHPYIQNLFKHKDELSLGNDIRIAVAAKKGDIFDPAYLETVKLLTDDVFYLSDRATPEEAELHQIVDRPKLKSLWTPSVRWSEVTKDGFQGGEVTQGYEGNLETMDTLRSNILRSGQVGRLVADDFKSSIVHIPLLDGEKIDYRQLAANLEVLREKYEAQNPNVEIHIIGFAKKVGDLIEGATKIAFFFLVAALITLLLLIWDFRDVRASLLILGCSVAAVVWQLGIVRLLGFGIDPYSMLVPFVVFAIAVSHSVQIVNAIFGELSRGAAPEAAARQALSTLFKPGVIALTTDILGFLTLLIIEIDVIRALAIAASVGTLMIAFTNFLMLPLLMANFRPSAGAMRKMEIRAGRKSVFWQFLSKKTERGPASVVVALGAILLVGGYVISKDVKIGDLDRGAPELRPDSRYNQDDLFITSNYSISADVLVVMVETPPQECSTYRVLESVDRLQWTLENVPGVQSAQSLVTAVKRIQSGFNEGNLKWATLVNDDGILNESGKNVPELYNSTCSLVPVFVFLDDHKAETLTRVTRAVEDFAKANNTDDVKFVLASGNAGIEAATNAVIGSQKTPMLLLVYTVVITLCFLAFRSWRPVVCVILPLVLTSILCEALMALLGIGIKVGTMPVIALGVGIGVDYGLYIFARLEQFLREGLSLKEAYLETLASTGKAVLFTGMALAIGVFTWVFSPIKFQADMGLLLTVMFLWNMVGALVMIPALAYFVIKPEQYRKA